MRAAAGLITCWRRGSCEKESPPGMSDHGAMRFPTTRWTLLDRAARGDAEVRHQALADLLRLYVGPIRAFIIARRGVSPDQADDILQDFLSVKWLEQDLLSRAQREKGRFRSYLLTALDHFISNWYRKRRADGRGVAAAGAAATETDSATGTGDEPAAPGGR